MEWTRLIKHLRARGRVRAERLADLLELDLQGEAKSGKLAKAFGSGFGDHVSKDFCDHFGGSIAGVVRDRGADNDEELCSALAWELAAKKSGGEASFTHITNSNNELGQASKIWPPGARAVRYLAIFDVLKFHLDPGIDLPPDNPARASAAVGKLEAGLKRNLAHPAPKGASLGNPYDGRVWVTVSGDKAPHEAALLGGLTKAQVCRAIVQKMALPGYETPGACVERVGLVALEYNLGSARSLYRPTIADALGHPYFFPGRKGETSGETCPLVPALDEPGERTEAGIREWIHRNYNVVLLPKDATDANACRVTWYGTFA